MPPGTLLPRRRLLTGAPRPLVLWEWGAPGARPIVLVHGWGDSGATFEHLAGHLAHDHHLVAPDLPGFGESPRASGYWFPDYLKDVDAVLDAVSPGAPVTLVGHSMGGNICGLYAGVRPGRVASLALLEGFGLPPTVPSEVPARYARWLDEEANPPRLRDFADEAALRRHLGRLAPAAEPAVIAALVPRWAEPLADGSWRLRMDPLHKSTNAVRYRRDEAAACWQATSAPVMLVAGRETDFFTRFGELDPLSDCAAHYAQVTCHWIEGAGHMMHWEKPAEVAALIRLAASRAGAGEGG